MELIKDNYLRGFGTGDTWRVEIDPPTRPVKSYFEEMLISSEYIYANKTGKLYLLVSGGLDSEYVFRVFKYLKFDFTPVIIRYTGKYHYHDYNLADTQYAFALCESMNATPLVIEFNVDKWIESGDIFEKMHSIRTGFPVTATYLHVIESLDGFTVLGNDPPFVRYNEETGVWQLEEEESAHAQLRNYKLNNMQGCPYTLSYTAEMMLSFLLEKRIVDLVNNKLPGKTGTNSSKSYVYNNGSGFNIDHYDPDSTFKFFKNNKMIEFLQQPSKLLTLPRIKFNGWELIRRLPFYRNHPEKLKNFNLDANHLYRGCYSENYFELVLRLSINQHI